MSDRPVSPQPENGGPGAGSRRADRERPPWLLGLILLVVGAVLLLQNLRLLPGNWLANWWALFILIPAVGSFSGAVTAYRQGHARAAIGPFVGGVVLTLVALTFLFSWSWSIMGPALLIAGGVALLLGAMVEPKHKA